MPSILASTLCLYVKLRAFTKEGSITLYFGRVAVFLWVAAEIVAYGLVIQQFGIAMAVLVGIISLALGLASLRRLGLRLATIELTEPPTTGAVVNAVKGMGWAAFGALLLILPGFVSNAVGLALLLFHAGALIAPARAGSGVSDSIIDLDKDDWRESQQDRAQLSKRDTSASRDILY